MSDGELPGWLLFRVLSGPSRTWHPVYGFQSGWTRAGDQQPLSPEAEMQLIVWHVTEWGYYGCSPFLSTTTNFLWAMWEAGRRQALWETGRGADWHFRPQILVIDSRCLPAENVLRITESPYVLPPGECRNFAKSSSEVLVKDRIPNDAVLAQIEWSDICDHLPPFFDLKVTFVDFYGNPGTYHHVQNFLSI